MLALEGSICLELSWIIIFVIFKSVYLKHCWVFSTLIQLLCISELIKIQGMDSNLRCFSCSQPGLVGRVCARAAVSITAHIRGLERSSDKTESLFSVNCHWIRLQLHKRRRCPTARVSSWANTWTKAILPVRPRAQDLRHRPCATQLKTSGMTVMAFSFPDFQWTLAENTILFGEISSFKYLLKSNT